MYGWANPKLPSTLAMLKVRAIGKRTPFEATEQPFLGCDASAALKRKRPVYSKEGGGFTETACYDGNSLRNGNTIAGPAIIEERRTTVVVPKGWQIKVDHYGNYLATLQ